MSTSKTLITPEQFVPPVLMRFLGQDRVPALIKQSPEDFQVEERQTDKQCTVTPESDWSEDFASSPVKRGLISMTLVKRQKTTFAAVYEVARRLGVKPENVTYAGLKDRWALTAQRIVVEGITLDEARRHCCPEAIRGAGWFLKDPVPADRRLSKGQLLANRFTLKVKVPGLTAEQIQAYVEPRLAAILESGCPNLYGRQRLGRRQNLYHVGDTLIHEGAEAAIRRFLCETSPNERPQATEMRKRIDEQWYHFDRISDMLEHTHQQLNMDVEYKIAKMLWETGSFEKTMHGMQQEFSLWVGAYQSYWFNQALAGVLQGDIPLNGGGSIPLLVCDPESERFYRRYLPESVAGQVNAEVRKLFLTPRRNGRGQVSRPWRKAIIPVMDLTHRSEDGIWYCQFELRSGAYATTLLSLLFEMDQDDDGTDDRKRYSPTSWDDRDANQR
jgi:TruD family tRNA pseudouridine synthase